MWIESKVNYFSLFNETTLFELKNGNELPNYLFYFQKLNNNNIFYSFRYNVVKKVEKENNVHHYLVVGRHAPTEKNKNLKIYKMRILPMIMMTKII